MERQSYPIPLVPQMIVGSADQATFSDLETIEPRALRSLHRCLPKPYHSVRTRIRNIRRYARCQDSPRLLDRYGRNCDSSIKASAGGSHDNDSLQFRLLQRLSFGSRSSKSPANLTGQVSVDERFCPHDTNSKFIVFELYRRDGNRECPTRGEDDRASLGS